MRWDAEGRGRRGALVAAVLLACTHFLLRPLLAGWWGTPDLVVAGLLVMTLHHRPAAAATAGFVFGLLDAAMGLEELGPLAVAYAVAGYGAGRAWEFFFADARLFLPLYLVSVSLVLLVIHHIVTTSDIMWNFILLEAPVGALLTAAVAGAVGKGLPTRAA